MIKLITIVVTLVVAPTVVTGGLMVRELIKNGDTSKLMAESMAPLTQSLDKLADAVDNDTRVIEAIHRDLGHLNDLHKDENSIFATKHINSKAEKIIAITKESHSATSRVETKCDEIRLAIRGLGNRNA